MSAEWVAEPSPEKVLPVEQPKAWRVAGRLAVDTCIKRGVARRLAAVAGRAGRSAGSQLAELQSQGVGLPVEEAESSNAEAGLPTAEAGLPATKAGPPAAEAGLSAEGAGLPTVKARLPAAEAGLPAEEAARDSVALE